MVYVAISKRRAAQSAARRSGSAHFSAPSRPDLPAVSDREWVSSIPLRNCGEEAEGPAGKGRHAPRRRTGGEALRGAAAKNRKQ